MAAALLVATAISSFLGLERITQKTKCQYYFRNSRYLPPSFDIQIPIHASGSILHHFDRNLVWMNEQRSSECDGDDNYAPFCFERLRGDVLDGDEGV